MKKLFEFTLPSEELVKETETSTNEKEKRLLPQKKLKRLLTENTSYASQPENYLMKPNYFME